MTIINFDNSKIASNTYDRSNATKDRYWKRQEAIAESGRNGALLAGGLIYGINVLENKELQKIRKKHLSNLKTHYNDIGNTISKLKNEGRKTYQAYFDWATAQHPIGGLAGDLQNATNTKYRNVLNEYASTLNKGNVVRQQLRTDIRNTINKIRETSGKNLFRVSGYNAGMLGLIGLSGAYTQHKLNEARAKRQEAGYASEKTASSNLPDRLRYTHTIDTEVVPDEVAEKLNLWEAIKKHKKQLAYGGAAAALAGSALYAAHKRSEKNSCSI